MSFVSFVGRLLFVSVFILVACQRLKEFGGDGGPAAAALRSKFNVFSKHVLSCTGFKLPEIEMQHLIAGAIALKGLGSLLFIFRSSTGAYLLLLHQALVTPILYDFYNYDADRKEFSQLFVQFTRQSGLISKNCAATVGQVGNVGVNRKSLGRAGSKRWLEFVSVWRFALLHRHEELHVQETSKEEANTQAKNNLKKGGKV